ncbi:hypothetical protein L323_09800 [Ruminiclostridium papyrosolvens C7]|uniref:Uncharacterized protein n=1 Tax=Ruminiclostridium papyrosolvens C7 TaxID=1330534 RepID=U4R358_9FIRM|nr:hypothetical protein L323_09800 [Ruminiclostridium papyrosolvens C7]
MNNFSFYYQLVFLGWYSVRGYIRLINDLGISHTIKMFLVLFSITEIIGFVILSLMTDSLSDSLNALKHIPYDFILAIVYLGYFEYPAYYKNTNMYVYLAPLLGTLCLIVTKKLRGRTQQRIL